MATHFTDDVKDPVKKLSVRDRIKRFESVQNGKLTNEIYQKNDKNSKQRVIKTKEFSENINKENKDNEKCGSSLKNGFKHCEVNGDLVHEIKLNTNKTQTKRKKVRFSEKSGNLTEKKDLPRVIEKIIKDDKLSVNRINNYNQNNFDIPQLLPQSFEKFSFQDEHFAGDLRIEEFEREIYFNDLTKNEILLEESRQSAQQELQQYCTSFLTEDIEDFEEDIYFDPQKRDEIIVETLRDEAMKEYEEYNNAVCSNEHSLEEFEEDVYFDSKKKNEILIEETRREARKEFDSYNREFQQNVISDENISDFEEDEEEEVSLDLTILICVVGVWALFQILKSVKDYLRNLMANNQNVLIVLFFVIIFLLFKYK